ncbi:hypothetical protein RY831_12570 [Noviherbaspirillum sp. CPCC 100848]|uniref:Uncharacterized protein n=1 Tax=Noviherbaspirillum album TaxID=3080276 RepID=A0ABU6J973_9BURK|nr:hypothetical protein [Noviherbaspirillum sp. CPCC 100848]MEC4719988.1 hypothetical protein [Noviherbaspirillum sp. CPCC 100848]
MASRILRGVHRKPIRLVVVQESERLELQQSAELFMDGGQSPRQWLDGFFHASAVRIMSTMPQ